jgi:hypothetical protein
MKLSFPRTAFLILVLVSIPMLAFGQARLFAVDAALAQRRSEQACGVQWLQHVVAHRGEEARLRLLRGFGFARAQLDDVGTERRHVEIIHQTVN